MRSVRGLVLTEHVESGKYPPERIDADHLVLRRLCQDDAAAVAEAVMASMKHLEPWLPWATQAAADVANQRSRIAEAEDMWEAGTDFIYTVLLPSAPTCGSAVQGDPDGAIGGAAPGGTAPIVGTFGLHRRIGPGGIEMGYWIGVDHAGRGYGTAAARALTPVALALPGVERVEIHCDAANAASAAIPRRLGYRLDRMEERQPEATGETGQHMIWVLDGQPPVA